VFPPALIAASLQGLASGLASDRVAEYVTAHDEASAAVSRLIGRLEDGRTVRLRA
jgi:hypothetical protein